MERARATLRVTEQQVRLDAVNRRRCSQIGPRHIFGHEPLNGFRAIKARPLSDDEKQMLKFGFWSIALIIDPPQADAVPSQEFMAKIASSNPKYSGWPMG